MAQPTADNKPSHGRRRIVIDRLFPNAADGNFPTKRVVGDTVEVEAHILVDGDDAVSARLLYRGPGETDWRFKPLRLRWNDEWLASFRVAAEGTYEYTVEAWVDHYATWARDIAKRAGTGQDIAVDLRIGADLLKNATRRAQGPDRERLSSATDALLSSEPLKKRLGAATGSRIVELVGRGVAPALRVRHDPPLRVTVDRERARFSAWYEMFPRSAGDTPNSHGTFDDVIARLPAIQSMGFDVLYLPPIHPIGHKHRKGANNNTVAAPGDEGSPWAIGASEGGHKSVHPALGTLDDFRRLVAAAEKAKMEVALDIAFQCSPDHPYVTQHPTWFRKRPDGSIQYAENPPKKYEDIYPFDFESRDWKALWDELKSVFEFWMEQGIRIFRVDNPHTKSFAFWEWCIAELKKLDPGLIFLAEAFTRPKIMYRLAALGFSQSYTYFTWRTGKTELQDYLLEVTGNPIAESFRPNFWPNTPELL